MSGPPNPLPHDPDPELARLVSRFLDQSLTPGEAAQLEDRLREDSAAQDYCARALRFDAAMQEALDPRALEWEETRRIVFDPSAPAGKPALSVQRNQTFRYGRSASGLEPAVALPGPPAARSRRWLFVGLATTLFALAALGGLLHFYMQGKTYALRNGDFEATDLGPSPSGVSRSILSWQDNFATPDAELCEIARVSKGRIFASSGRNVVRLQDHAFLNQRILNRRDGPLAATPGLKVILHGSYYTEPSTAENETDISNNGLPSDIIIVSGSPRPVHHHFPPDPSDDIQGASLRCSLRFVASGYPDMIQYEAAKSAIPVEASGWHPFRVELTVTNDLIQPPSDLSAHVKTSPPSLDLTGRDLILSVDARTPDAVLYLDNLSIEVVPPDK